MQQNDRSLADGAGTFDLLCKERFALDPETFGYFLSFIGVCFAVCNAVLVCAAQPTAAHRSPPRRPKLLPSWDRPWCLCGRRCQRLAA